MNNLEARFWAKVQKGEGCWHWTAAKNNAGYGVIGQGSPSRALLLAHRVSYGLAKGPIPSGRVIDHTCHNRACVNPSHLRAATLKENNENQSRVRRDNRHQLAGVGLNKRNGRYRARVTHNGREHYGGEYMTAEEAAEAARNLRLSLFTHNERDKAVDR